MYKTKVQALSAKARFLKSNNFPEFPKKHCSQEDEVENNDSNNEYEEDEEGNALYFHFDDESFFYDGDCDSYSLEVKVKPFHMDFEGDDNGCMFSYDSE